jgi:DNA polymerase III delta prime subunit
VGRQEVGAEEWLSACAKNTMPPGGPAAMDYNPAMAWSILGHAWAIDLLRRHIRAGGVRHAYLFTGPDQVGKRTLAVAFAQALTCPEVPEPGEACGRCRTCETMRAGTHPDLSIVRLVPGDSEIKIDQVRELQRQLALTPRQAARRVALLVDFDAANESAQNALLKTLEEPAEKVVLLLTAGSSAGLLPRCFHLEYSTCGRSTRHDRTGARTTESRMSERCWRHFGRPSGLAKSLQSRTAGPARCGAG